MKDSQEQKIMRIAVFYDGAYLSHISTYYRYNHPRKAGINLQGLHTWIAHEVANLERRQPLLCHITDAHLFRGKYAPEDQADEYKQKEERFEHVLSRLGIQQHYLPMVAGGGEKGIDVWLAITAIELGLRKTFDICALVAGDGDFTPLVRRLKALGLRVMVLGWDFQYTNRHDIEHTTETAQSLLDAATYPVMMSSVINDRCKQKDILLNGIFMPPKVNHNSTQTDD